MGRFTRDPFAAHLHRQRLELVALVGARAGGAEALDLRATYQPSMLHAFEPRPARLPLCRAALGGLPGLALHPFALWERPGTIALPGAEAGLETRVRAAILRNVMAAEGLPGIDLLCLDAGAAALPVLRGAGQRLGDVRFVLAALPREAREGVEACLGAAGFLGRAEATDGDGQVILLHENPGFGQPRPAAPPGTDAAFLRRFDREWAPRLLHRADTFREAFARLLEAGSAAGPRILELGCLRRRDGVLHGPPTGPDHPWEWGGRHGPWSEGNSTLLFDRFAEACGGQVVSVDRDPAACALARAASSAATTTVIEADSLAAIGGDLSPFGVSSADLVYLDTFATAGAPPDPSDDHHRREIEAIWPRLRPGSLLLVDDGRDPETGRHGPGHRVVGAVLRGAGLVPVAEGFQALWRKP